MCRTQKIISPMRSKKENVCLTKIGVCQRGVIVHPHRNTTSTVFHYSMARTRGGKVARPMAPPRVYLMPNGVKVRRMDGEFRYQPPSLKTLSSIMLDQTKRDPSPNLLLYQSVQKVLDKLIELVEDKVLGLDIAGIPKN